MSDRPIQAIVIHRCESGTTGVDVARAEAAEDCGYHYFIRADGQVDQLYPDECLVWHALHWSRNTIAVAVYGDFDPGEHGRNAHPTPEQLRAARDLCLSLWRRHGMLPLLGHTDLPSASRYPTKRCPGSNVDLRALERDVWIAYVSGTPTTSA